MNGGLVDQNRATPGGVEFFQTGRTRPSGRLMKGKTVVKTLLVLLCLVLPFLAVLIKEGPSLKVLWAFLLQLCGHIPGVIYGIYQVVRD
jgi:uncharacterized membrane protein YqaE (UPF0057 family)